MHVIGYDGDEEEVISKIAELEAQNKVFAANILLIWPFKWDGNSSNLIAEGDGMANMLVGYYRCWMLPLPIL